MHSLLVILSVMLIVLVCYLTLGVVRRLDGWGTRRDLQFWVLLVPCMSLLLSGGALFHVVYQDCLFSAPTWDYLLAVMMPVGMGLVVLGSLLFGVVRLVLVYRFVVRGSIEAPYELQELVNRQVEQLEISRPRLLVRVHNQPMALICGLWRPTLVLSTWMLEQLDQHELESVLAHELAHVARRDSLIIWLATILRDAFFYLPTTHIAYHQLQREKELACDDLAVELTYYPLALASALAKVWQELVREPTMGVAQSLAGQGDLFETRIERLMIGTIPVIQKNHSRAASLGVTTLSLISLTVLETISVVVILALMGCGPMTSILSLLIR